jgi:hypothetical protein
MRRGKGCDMPRNRSGKRTRIFTRTVSPSRTNGSRREVVQQTVSPSRVILRTGRRYDVQFPISPKLRFYQVAFRSLPSLACQFFGCRECQLPRVQTLQRREVAQVTRRLPLEDEEIVQLKRRFLTIRDGMQGMELAFRTPLTDATRNALVPRLQILQGREVVQRHHEVVQHHHV